MIRLRYIAAWLGIQSVVLSALVAIALNIDPTVMVLIGLAVGFSQVTLTFAIGRSGLSDRQW
jgi:hypothetical protein